MRKLSVVALLGIALYLPGSAGIAAEAALTPRSNLIHVNGRAVIPVVPDTAKVQFQVRVEGQDLGQVGPEANRTMQALLSQIRALNLGGVSLEATGVSLAANYPQPKGGQPAGGGAGAGGNAPPGPPQPTSYSAAIQGTVLFHGDLSVLRQGVAQVQALVLAVPGASLAASPSVYKEDTTAARQQALEAAIREAVGNAQAMARGMGVTISGYGYASMDMSATAPGRGGLTSQPMIYRTDYGYMSVSMGAPGTVVSPPVQETTEVEASVTLDAAYPLP